MTEDTHIFPLPQAGEGSRVRGFEQASHFQVHINPHPQPFSRLREKGAYCMA